jgi:hypothetical protein
MDRGVADRQEDGQGSVYDCFGIRRSQRRVPELDLGETRGSRTTVKKVNVYKFPKSDFGGPLAKKKSKPDTVTTDVCVSSEMPGHP